MTPLAYGYIAGIVALPIAHAVWQAHHNRWLALDPLNVFWGGLAAVSVIQPLSYGDLYARWHRNGTVEEALFWTVFAVGWVIAGYEAAPGRSWIRKTRVGPRLLDQGRLLAGATLLIATGLGGWAYLVSSAGNLTAWLDVGRGGTDWANVSGYYARSCDLLPIGIGVLLYRAELSMRKSSRVIAWTCAGFQLWWFAYLGTRSRTVLFVILMLSAWFLPRRRNPPLAVLVVMFFALLVVVNFQANYRGQFRHLSMFSDVNVAEALEKSAPRIGASDIHEGSGVSTSRAAEFNCVLSVMELMPDAIPFNWGASHAELLTRWMPRSVWPDKAYPHARVYTPVMRTAGLSGAEIQTSEGPALIGPAFTYVGHWWSVGGPIALILAGFLTGGGLRGIRELYERRPGDHYDLILYSLLLPLGFTEAAGEPFFWPFTLPFTLIPLVLILRWSKVRRTPPVARRVGAQS